MRTLLYVAIAASLVGCATKPDPIAQLVTRISAEPMWRYGIYPTIDLPQTATSRQVVEQIFKTTAFRMDSGIRPVTSFKILQIREANIPTNDSDAYTVALVETDLGRKITVFRWEQTTHSWWSRVYDAKPSAKQATLRHRETFTNTNQEINNT